MSPNAVDPRLSAPYRLYFWANENLDTHKDPHVHVESGDGWAEFWLSPVRVKDDGSYNDFQRNKAKRMVERFESECLAEWRRVHDSD